MKKRQEGSGERLHRMACFSRINCGFPGGLGGRGGDSGQIKRTGMDICESMYCRTGQFSTTAFLPLPQCKYKSRKTFLSLSSPVKKSTESM